MNRVNLIRRSLWTRHFDSDDSVALYGAEHSPRDMARIGIIIFSGRVVEDSSSNFWTTSVVRK